MQLDLKHLQKVEAGQLRSDAKPSTSWASCAVSASSIAVRSFRSTVVDSTASVEATSRSARQTLIDEVPVVVSPPRSSVGTPDTSRPHKNRFLVFREDEINAVLVHLPEWHHAPRAPRPYPVRARFIIAWETALRPETLDKLCAPEDYRRGTDGLFIRDEIDKARFGRRLPLTDRARAALDSVCPDIGLIFGRHDHRNLLHKAAAKAELPPEKAERISPYDFRHSRLTFLAENSTNLAGIAYLAGHKNVSTTNLYIRPTEHAAEQVLDAVNADSGHILATEAKARKSARKKKTRKR